MPPSARTLDSLTTPSTTGVSPSGSVSPDAYQQFNSGLIDMLKQSQSLGTAGFANQGFNAQSEQASRISAPTQQNLIGAAPSLQNSVRQASASAVNPTIQGAQQSGQTFGEQLGSFGNLLQYARQINSDYESQLQQAKDSAFNKIMSTVQTYGASAFKGLNEDEINNLEKTAGLPSGFLSRMQSTLAEQNQNKPVEVNPGNSLVNPQTGQSIYTNTNPTSTTQVNGAPPNTSTDSINNARAALSATRNQGAEADGVYADPNAYLSLYTEWHGKGGSDDAFFKAYDPNAYLNPANTWIAGKIPGLAQVWTAKPKLKTTASSGRSI